MGVQIILKITGVKVTVIGEENVPDEPVLLFGNHRSFFVYSADILPPANVLTGYVAKELYGKEFRSSQPGCDIFTACF